MAQKPKPKTVKHIRFHIAATIDIRAVDTDELAYVSEYVNKLRAEGSAEIEDVEIVELPAWRAA